jgi:hypothetical protein
VFEMAAPIQSPTKCKVRSIIHFLNAKGERPAEIHRLLLFMVTFKSKLFLNLKKHNAGKNFDDDDEVQEEVMTWFKGQAADLSDAGLQKLVPRLVISRHQEQCAGPFRPLNFITYSFLCQLLLPEGSHR